MGKTFPLYLCRRLWLMVPLPVTYSCCSFAERKTLWEFQVLALYFLLYCVQILLYLLRDIPTFLPSFIWKPLVPSMLNTSTVEVNKIKSPVSGSSEGNGVGRDHIAYCILSVGVRSSLRWKWKEQSAEPEASRIEHVPSTVWLLHRELGDGLTGSRWGWEGLWRPRKPCSGICNLYWDSCRMEGIFKGEKRHGYIYIFLKTSGTHKDTNFP